jgi:hypothetical protein
MDDNHGVCIQDKATRDELDTDFNTFSKALEVIRQELEVKTPQNFFSFDASCHAFINGSDKPVMRWQVKLPSNYFNLLRDTVQRITGVKFYAQ